MDENISNKSSACIALAANIKLQTALIEQAHKYEAQLKEFDRLLVRFTAQS
jgi:hypothetical protein